MGDVGGHLLPHRFVLLGAGNIGDDNLEAFVIEQDTSHGEVSAPFFNPHLGGRIFLLPGPCFEIAVQESPDACEFRVINETLGCE